MQNTPVKSNPKPRPSAEDCEVPVKRELIDSWLLRYGVVDARELDLGTLASIGEQIRDGVGPSDGF